MLDRQIASIARQQHGVLTTAQLRENGVSDHDLLVRLRAGSLIRLNQNAVAVAGAPSTWHQAAFAALVGLKDSGLSDLSAARLHGLPCSDDSIHVVAPFEANARLRGVKVRRSRNFGAIAFTTVQGLRATTLEQTLVDLGALISEGRLRSIISAELARRSTSLDRLWDRFSASCRPGQRGAARTRRVLGSLEGRPPTESELEAAFVELLRGAGIAVDTTQATAPWAATEPGRVDVMFTEQRLIVELDGRTFHLREQAFEQDRWRDQQALLRGFRTVRFTHRQVTGNPGSVLEVMQGLLNPSG